MQTVDGQLYECKTRGKLKEQVVSGDWVTFTRLDDGRGILEGIQPRKNLLYLSLIHISYGGCKSNERGICPR